MNALAYCGRYRTRRHYASYDGHAVYVGDVADVRTGMASRQGMVAYYRAGVYTHQPGVDDLVEGIVVNRKGTNAQKVIDAVETQSGLHQSTHAAQRC